MQLAPGMRLGPYEVVAPIGSGGAGEVYLASDTRLGRSVALKVLSGASNALGLLEREARLAASLSHPNVARIYEVGHDCGRDYIAMEYVEGEALASRVERGPLDVAEAVDVAISVAEALDAAHALGLAHCDLSSSNVILTGRGRAVVLDFGLARGGTGGAAPGAGREYARGGTVAFMSPEQARGADLDARTDLFSLGAVLYEAITASRPFAGASAAEVAAAVVDREPLPASASRDGVPLELESILRRALRKRPEERYASAAELLDDLRRLRARLGGAAGGRGGAETAPRRPRRWLDALRSRTAAPHAEGVAFRGLLAFQEADSDRFYGREAESRALLELVTHDEFRFGVLYGESGCGKTSLVRAGLQPRLWDAGFVPLWCRSYGDPVGTLVDECRRRCAIAPRAGESPSDFLRRAATEMGGAIVAVFDQFEEFFVAHRTAREREPFLAFVAACHEDSSLPVRFLFAIRSDFLYLIGPAFDERVSEPLLASKRSLLEPFDEERAAEVIERSARRAGLPFETALSRHVARDLAVDGRVLPSELQIVGERLQSRRLFTIRDYRRAGGTEVLVYDYLEEVIRFSGEREAASLVLRALISDDNTRATLTLAEVARRTQLGVARASRILRLFVDARLARELQDEEPWRYELVHEYLVERVNRVTGRVMDATQRANRLFREYMSSSAVDSRTRIPLARVWFIRRYSDMPRGERERALLRRSLRRGLLEAGALAMALAAAVVAAAAALSVEERWEGVQFADGHTAAARRAIFSPDGRRLVSVGEDGKVIVWDFERRELLAELEAHTGWVTSVDFSPDGRWFVTAGADGAVVVWDAARLVPAAVLRDHPSPVTAADFSPDGSVLVTADDGTAPGGGTILWEVGTWRRRHALAWHSSYANTAFSPDSTTLLAGAGWAWDVRTGARVASPLASETTPWNWAAVAPDGTRLGTAASNGDLVVFELATGAVVETRKLHADHCRSIAWSPDGRMIATAAEDVVLWDVPGRAKITRLEHAAVVWSVAFSPDGRWLVSAHGDGSILLWDVAERQRVANFNEHAGPVRAVAFAPDGRRVASAGEDGAVIVWDAATGRKHAVLLGHKTRCLSVAFSPDGATLVSGDHEGTVYIWALDRREARATARLELPFQIASYGVAISPDGRLAAATHGVYAIDDGRCVVSFHRDEYFGMGWAYGIRFTPAGHRLLLVVPHVGISLLDTGSWRLVETVGTGHTQPVAADIAPDGATFVTGDDEGRVRLWRTEPPSEERVLGSHAARVKSVAFSPDGRTVASAGDDRTIRLWDVASGREAGTVGTHMAPVLSVDFSPDGTQLVAGGHDRSVRVFTRRRSLWGYPID